MVDRTFGLLHQELQSGAGLPLQEDDVTLAHLDNRPPDMSEADWLIERAKRVAISEALAELFEPARVAEQAGRDE